MKSLITKIPGLLTILITDNFGVPIIKGMFCWFYLNCLFIYLNLILISVPSELSHEVSARPALMSSFAIGSDQAGKLGIGQCKTMTCQYNDYQIVHFNKHPLVVALIASTKTNTGMLLALDNEFDLICNELKKCVDNNNWFIHSLFLSSTNFGKIAFS